MCLLPPPFYSKNWILFLFCWRLGAWSRQEGCEVSGSGSTELTACSVDLVKEGSQWPPVGTWRTPREGGCFRTTWSSPFWSVDYCRKSMFVPRACRSAISIDAKSKTQEGVSLRDSRLRSHPGEPSVVLFLSPQPPFSCPSVLTFLWNIGLFERETQGGT